MMTGPTARQLGRRLRRLDRGELARFVAALWAASGWSTAVRDGRVVARRREPSRDRVELAVLSGHVDVGRALAGGPTDADRLVAPVGQRTALALAARTGLPVIDEGSLHERLTYAVEADAREHLLSEHAPGTRRSPSRRSVLAAVVGAGTAGAGAAAVAHDDGAVPAVWEGGDPPVGGADQSTAAGSLEPGTATGAGTHSDTAPGTDGCGAGPAETVAEQLSSMMLYLVPGGGTDADGDGQVEYGGPETTDAFRAAVEAAGEKPIQYAVSMSVGRPLEEETVTRVPASVRTRTDRRVVYEFRLDRTPEGCWRTRSAEIVATRDGG